MPSAIIQTHPLAMIDIPTLLDLYLEANKEMLLRVFDAHGLLVIDVLENFINEGCRLKSEPLLAKLIHFEFQEVAGVL